MIKIFLILILLCPNNYFSHAETPIQLVFNLPYEATPIRFWRANPNILPLIESHVFPIASMGADGSLENLGRAWITWTIQIENKKIAAWAIFSKGLISHFTLVDGYYDDLYWSWAQEELFLITSTSHETQFYWYSLNQETIHYSLPFNSSNHNMYIINQNHFQVFIYQNGTQPAIIDVNLLGNIPSITTNPTQEILISSFLNIGLFLLPDKSIELRTDQSNVKIPTEFSNQSIVGHFLSNPAVFDLQTGKAWSEFANPKLFNLPNNSESIFPFGLQSSIVKTTSNELYEFNNFDWINIGSFDPSYHIFDFAIIDIDLYIGTSPGDGLQLIVSGSDEDNDFIPDTMEDYYLTLPNSVDSDRDSIPDGLEIAYNTNPLIDDRFLDYDGDGLKNIEEFILKTDPNNYDTDYGGALDGWEVQYNFNPLDPDDDLLDLDNDGLPNSIESIWGSNPDSKDSDNDNIPDWWEVKYNLDPIDPSNANIDLDNDGKSNLQEYRDGTDPFIPDPKRIFDDLFIWIVMFIIIFIPITLIVYMKSFPDEK